MEKHEKKKENRKKKKSDNANTTTREWYQETSLKIFPDEHTYVIGTNVNGIVPEKIGKFTINKIAVLDRENSSLLKPKI